MRSGSKTTSAREARSQNQEGMWRWPLAIIASAIIAPGTLPGVEPSLHSVGDFETAVLARRIQWNDDCYQVLDDPSVVNRYAFETFHQYLAYCVEKKSRGEPLPWVRDVLAREKGDGIIFNHWRSKRLPLLHS